RGVVDPTVPRSSTAVGAPRDAGPIWHAGAPLRGGPGSRPISDPAGARSPGWARRALDAVPAPASDGIVRPGPRRGRPRLRLAVCARRVARRRRRAGRRDPRPVQDVGGRITGGGHAATL